MSDGLHAYTFDPKTRTVNQTEVYILHPASYAEVGTVEDQRRAIYALHGLPEPKS